MPAQSDRQNDGAREIGPVPAARPSRVLRRFFAVPVAITRMRGGLPMDAAARAETRGMSGSLNLVFTGEGGGTYHVGFDDGAFGVHRGSDPDARATVTLRESVFVELLTGKRDFMTAGATGRVRLVGDGEFLLFFGGLVESFRRMPRARGFRGRLGRRYARWVLRGIDGAAF